ncbi:DivIVA domain-containing protein [Nocardioides sp. NPDC092400]|uniref:DivIVA domain-containing protein n=1 Tax=Nocardioides sp. NPDC092400 TaxID=3155196 RepID=UPI00342B4198
MMWFFAVLVVLVMGGIAAVAAGRGAPMAEVEHDRLRVDVPEDRPLSAADMRRVRFPLALRGYRMQDVDALLDRLAREQDAREAATPSAPEVRGEGPIA